MTLQAGADTVMAQWPHHSRHGPRYSRSGPVIPNLMNAREQIRPLLPVRPIRLFPGHFYMLREFHLADLLTLCNAACGTLAVLLSLAYARQPDPSLFLLAALMAPAALLFDVLDGRVARWRHSQSALGRELDSLADVVSFGVAPAALGFAAGLSGGWDALVLVYFVCCGVSRLARYNVTAANLTGPGGKVAYFEGTPIPTSVVISAMLALAAWQDRLDSLLWGGAWQAGPWILHPMVLLYALSGTLMISKTLRIPKY